jgi:hypothetical protein
VINIRHANPLPDFFQSLYCRERNVVIHFTHFKPDGPPIPSYWDDFAIDFQTAVGQLLNSARLQTTITLVDFDLAAVNFDKKYMNMTVPEILSDMIQSCTALH